MSLPEKLKEVRRQHGCTRRQLAEELGRNYATITKYENGEREPGHTYLVEIARKFGVTTDYLLGLEEFSGDGAPVVSAAAMQLARDFDSLDEWGRKAVQNVVELELQRKAQAEEASPARRVPLPQRKAGKAQPLAAHDYTGQPLEVKNSPDLASEARESRFHD
ncbi:helix-turn-helix domain-containing protein [Dysosmobacter sp.]|uniref:helix-turn-helix domain-containing protein n=1 Tax=Dysosmobacter sp. TaxID=2591382 RepID=UPI002A885860|nr:helix-turn-helix transcriptional regulator [Dysosmobacter sp.]MDY3281449.1 helix-turn-helix transcriptional regulator [Dysosmobacter sp.]